MRYKWFLFDLDGTLTKSEEGIINSVRYALERLGKPVPPYEELMAFIGPPLLWGFMNVARLSETEAIEAVNIYRERYSEVGWKECEVYPGIPELLRGIKRRGGMIALASAKPEIFCKKIVEYYGIAPYLDRLSAISLTERSAEKKDIILRALPDPEERKNAVMIGDREYDIEGAVEAGVDAVGVEYGYGRPEEFKKAVASAKDCFELWDILVGGPRDRGAFITFEGVDGCGKSTQFKLATEYLRRRGWDMKTTREPGGCHISERIRELLLDVNSKGMTDRCEALLYAAARAQHVAEVIEPALNAGKLVLCDRFLDSSIAYQSGGRELTEDLIRQINMPATRGLNPDMTLVYMADLDVARARVAAGGEPDRLESEGDDFVRRVSDGYMRIIAKDPRRARGIDGMRGIDEVFADTRGHIDELLK